MSKSIGKFIAAMVIYAGFAVYLYQPYFRKLNPLQYLIVINVCLASLGCFVLSRRWVASFAGSFFAGAIYGFGPFMLGLAAYHPTAGLLAAAIPWLFLPAAFTFRYKWRQVGWLLAVLPFLAIVFFSQFSAHFRLFAIPTQIKLHLADLPGLLAPTISAHRNLTLLGVYHIPIASLIIGFAMLLKARRFGVIIIFAAGTIFGFCNSVFAVSPIIWLTIPMLCCSIVSGMGMQALAGAGRADRKWPLAAAVIMGALSIAALLLATKYFQVFAGLADAYAKLLTDTAKMYILGTVALAIIFFISRAKLRLHLLRWVILGSATAVDIFFSARFVVDKIL